MTRATGERLLANTNQMPAEKPKISVITATRNAAATIGKLYSSLTEQRYLDFEWVISDGASSDETVALLRRFSSQHTWIRFVSEPDFGIYHALNKAIAMAQGEYYVIAGADDHFEPTALYDYASAVSSLSADVVMARVRRAGRTIGGFHPRLSWLGPSRVFAGSHSVGTLIRTNLHEAFGPYSPRFPLLADAYFLKILLRSKAVCFSIADFVAGTFTEGGATTLNQLQLLAENWQIQLLTESRPIVQTILFFAKFAFRYPSVARDLTRSRARAQIRTADLHSGCA